MQAHRSAEARDRRRRLRVVDGQLDGIAVRRGSLRGRGERHDSRRREGIARPGRGRLAVAGADGACGRGRRRRRRLHRRARHDRPVDVVAVDVDRDSAPRLLVAALVLVDTLVVRPDAVAHVRVTEDAFDAVPVRDPDRVGRRGAERGNITNGGGGAAVDAGDEPVGAQPVDPADDERLHRLGARRDADLVPLHVGVDAGCRREGRSRSPCRLRRRPPPHPDSRRWSHWSRCAEARIG